ncbi:MAG: hypothetical protein Q9225_006202 [Loekoesia sp. 1 TL-2023]
MARQGRLRLTAGDGGDPSLTSVGSNEPSRGLCGARIAVYRHTGVARNEKKNVATIGGIFRVGRKYFGLTAAHVFFDNVASTGSWADSGLYVSTNSSSNQIQDVPRPIVSGLYEIFAESSWLRVAGAEGDTGDLGVSLGLFEPQVGHRRKEPSAKTFSEVIWNFEMDWALIELSEPQKWGTNIIQLSSGTKVELKPPAPNQEPPLGEVLIAAGISGPVQGTGLGTVGGIMLPWSSHETQAWSIEAEIASAVLKSILSQCGLPGNPLEDSFNLDGFNLSEAATKNKPMEKTQAPRQSLPRSDIDSIIHEFASVVREYTMQNVYGKRFILIPFLRQWLLAKGSPFASRLDLLLDSVYSEMTIVPIEADAISSGSQECLLVFSMLVELGHGYLIDRFQKYGLTDSRLPFDLKQVKDYLIRMAWPNADELAQVFWKTQWAYLPMRFEYGFSCVCPPQNVIPIQRRQRVNDKGAIAELWQVEVPEAFVGHKLRQMSSNARSIGQSGTQYRFALKSFRAHLRSLFDSERSAFRAFDNIRGMTRCLGDFIQESEDSDWTYNILLEYGELDLDEYFFSKAAPVTPADIVSFWKKMLNIASTVSDIHLFAKARAGVMQAYSGLHGDIKPDNILLIQGNFKLADPGFARYEKSGEGLTSALGGTRTYEHHDGRFVPAEVSQASDIWSLGCVFSLAATWIVLGGTGIEQFDKLRQSCRERRDVQTYQPFDHAHDRAALPSHNAFHDNAAVLPEVTEWHQFLRISSRRSDFITTRMLDLLDSQVLVMDPAQRINIRTLYAQMFDIVAQAEMESHWRPQAEPILRLFPVEDLDMPIGGASQVLEGNSALAHESPVSTHLAVPSSQLGSSLRPPERLEENSSSLQPSRKRSASVIREEPSEISKTSYRQSSTARTWHQTLQLTPRHSRNRPHQTVSQAQEYVKIKKRGFSFKSRHGPKDDVLERHLYNRDISFLVDNAESMEQHWEEATTVLTTLMKKIKGIDADGVDLWFTTGSVQVRNCTKSSTFVEAMRDKSAMPRKGLHTDMNRSLGAILSSFLQQMKSKPKSTSLRAIERGFTLIVLTDGAWEGMRQKDTIDRTIAHFAQSLREVQGHSLLQRPVSIEFIRFGNDKQAIEYLERLDHDLKFEGIPDIVDTTPSTGNVFKMLLGSFLEEFDDERYEQSSQTQ